MALTAEKNKQPHVATNGVHKNTPAIISTEIKKDVQEEKKEGSISVLPTEKSLNLTLKRIRELNLIADKRAKLIEVQDNLNAFKLSTDKMQDKLVLSDSFGNKFETSNTAAIADVLALLKSSVNSLIDETETLLTL